MSMAVDQVISSAFGTANFAEYEQDVYKKYQEIAEQEIMTQLNTLKQRNVCVESDCDDEICALVGTDQTAAGLRPQSRIPTFNPVLGPRDIYFIPRPLSRHRE